eukprot:460009-Prymnesium_polylepis.1
MYSCGARTSTESVSTKGSGAQESTVGATHRSASPREVLREAVADPAVRARHQEHLACDAVRCGSGVMRCGSGEHGLRRESNKTDP